MSFHCFASLTDYEGELTCSLDNSIVDIVFDLRGSYVKGSLGSNLSCICVYVQPLFRVSANFIPVTQGTEEKYK